MTATGTGQTGHDGVAAAELPPGLAQARHLARHQIMGLTAAFLLGLAANLTGPPSQTRGAAHIARIAFVAAHVLIALGLVIGTALLLRAALGSGGRWRRQAIGGASAVAATAAAGILTLLTTSNWWSYAMAAGFIAAFLIYGDPLIQLGTRERRPDDQRGTRY